MSSAGAGIEGDRQQALSLDGPPCHDRSGRAAEPSEGRSGEQIQFAIGDVERIRIGIEREPAKRGAGISSAVELHVGEQTDGAGHAVDLPDRSGPPRRRRRPEAEHEGSRSARRSRNVRPAVRPGRNDR